MQQVGLKSQQQREGADSRRTSRLSLRSQEPPCLPYYSTKDDILMKVNSLGSSGSSLMDRTGDY